MRILQIVHQYPPEQLGGSELYTHQLTSALNQHVFKSAIFTRRNRADHGWALEQYESVPIYSAWADAINPAQRYLTTFHNRSLVDSFHSVVDHFAPDLVHVQHLMGLPLALIDILQTRQIPYLLSLHDYWWVCTNANLITNYSGAQCKGPYAQVNCTRCVIPRTGSSKNWALAPAIWGAQQWRAIKLRQILHGAATILAPSDFVRNWYIAHGIAPAAIQTAPLGVDLPPNDLQIFPKTDDKVLRFLYLGGIAQIKGVHLIIEAMRNVMGNVELWIAGDLTSDPVYTKHLQSLATDKIRFCGKLDRVQVWQMLASADLLLVPSLTQETYCFSAREAQAVGTPLFASSAGALTEIVHAGLNGLLLPRGDVAAWQIALQQCIDNPAQLQYFRQQAIKPMTVAAHVEQIEAIYQQIVFREGDTDQISPSDKPFPEEDNL